MNVMKLKTFLDEIIPQTLPFFEPNLHYDLGINNYNNDRKYANPLPLDIPCI